MMNQEASIDMERLRSIHERVDVPLVIHGGTSFPPSAVGAAIAQGVAKFNVGTALKVAFLEGVREAAGALARDADPHRVLGSHTAEDLLARGQSRMREKVRTLIRVYGSSARA